MSDESPSSTIKEALSELNPEQRQQIALRAEQELREEEAEEISEAADRTFTVNLAALTATDDDGNNYRAALLEAEQQGVVELHLIED